MGPWDGPPPPRQHHSSAAHVSGALPNFASSCYFKSVPWGEAGAGPSEGTHCSPFPDEYRGVETEHLAWGGSLSWFSRVVSQAARTRTGHRLSTPVPTPLALISKSQRARCFCSPRRRRLRGDRILWAPGRTSHHLQDAAQTAGSALPTEPFPKMDQKHSVMSVGASFQKAHIPGNPPTPSHPQPDSPRQAGGLPQSTRPSLSPGSQTHTGSCTNSLVCTCYTRCPVGSSLKSPRFGRSSEVRPTVVSVQWSHPTIDNGPHLVRAFPVMEASAVHFLFQAFPAASPQPEQVSWLLHS